MEVQAAPSEGSVGTAAGLDRGSQLIVRQAELARSGPHRQAMLGLGLHRRIEPHEDIESDRARPMGHVGQRGRLVRRLDGHPAQRISRCGRRHDCPKVRIGLADSLEGDGLVRQPGTAGDRPFPQRDDVGSEPVRGDARDERSHVVGLDRILPDPGIREGGPDLFGGGRQGTCVGQVQRGAVAPGGRTQVDGDRRQAVRLIGRGRPVTVNHAGFSGSSSRTGACR